MYLVSIVKPNQTKPYLYIVVILYFDAISLLWIFDISLLCCFTRSIFFSPSFCFSFSSFYLPVQFFYHFIANFSKLSMRQYGIVCAVIIIITIIICLGSVTIYRPFNQNKWKRNWVAASESNWVNKVVHHTNPCGFECCCRRRRRRHRRRCCYFQMCIQSRITEV